MKIEITITASGKTREAVETLTEVVNYIRTGALQREASGEGVKVKAIVKVLEDEQ